MRAAKLAIAMIAVLSSVFCSSAFAGAPASDASETDALLRRVDEAEGSPSRRSAGPFTYPVSGAGTKLLPDISLIGTFAGGWFRNDPVDPEGHDPRRTGFTLQEIEVALQSNVDPYLRGDVFLGFSEEGVEVEEAFATTLALAKGLQIRAGKMLLPFGRQNVKHLEQRAFADDMLPNLAFFGPEALNEIGAELAYVPPLPFFLQVQATFSDGANGASFDGTGKGDFLYQGRLAGSADISPATTVLAGMSAAAGENALGPGEKTIVFGGDVLLKWKPGARASFVWQTEYAYRAMESPGTVLKDGGLYSYAEAQFAKRWHASFRYDALGWPADALARRHRMTPAFAFDPTEFSRLRVQASWDKTAGAESEYAAFLQIEFNMGPHGAHAF